MTLHGPHDLTHALRFPLSHPLIADRTAIGTWETFQLVHNSNGTVSLLASANGKYVTADNGGADPLIANRTAIGTWEQFDLATV
ncbi:fascin domain-containing protein [Streptomyces sp. NPDC000888]